MGELSELRSLAKDFNRFSNGKGTGGPRRIQPVLYAPFVFVCSMPRTRKRHVFVQNSSSQDRSIEVVDGGRLKALSNDGELATMQYILLGSFFDREAILIGYLQSYSGVYSHAVSERTAPSAAEFLIRDSRASDSAQPSPRPKEGDIRACRLPSAAPLKNLQGLVSSSLGRA